MQDTIRTIVRQNVLRALLRDKEITLAFDFGMSYTLQETGTYVHKLIGEQLPLNISRVLFIPSVQINDISSDLRARKVGCGVQNIHYASHGAYTGEVSARQVLSAGGSHVLLGSAYRRAVDDNAIIARKVKAALDSALTPVLCVGENLEQHKTAMFSSVVEKQVLSALDGFNLKRGDLMIAYQPVWAAERGKLPEPKQVSEALQFIRNLLITRYGAHVAEGTALLCGLDMPVQKVLDYAIQPGVDGLLLGGDNAFEVQSLFA